MLILTPETPAAMTVAECRERMRRWAMQHRRARSLMKRERSPSARELLREISSLAVTHATQWRNRSQGKTTL